MLLAIDVGNTNIVLGIFDGDRLVTSWRLLTLRERTADEVGVMVAGLLGQERIDPGSITSVVMSSVVPPLTPIMRGMVRRYFGRDTLIVDPTSNAGMPILYENPAEVGADRIANSIAAYERYGRKSGMPLIIADLGTTTTFDAAAKLPSTAEDTGFRTAVWSLWIDPGKDAYVVAADHTERWPRSKDPSLGCL